MLTSSKYFTDLVILFHQRNASARNISHTNIYYLKLLLVNISNCFGEKWMKLWITKRPFKNMVKKSLQAKCVKYFKSQFLMRIFFRDSLCCPCAIWPPKPAGGSYLSASIIYGYWLFMMIVDSLKCIHWHRSSYDRNSTNHCNFRSIILFVGISLRTSISELLACLSIGVILEVSSAGKC